MIDPQNFVLATVNELFFLPDKFIESSVLWLLLALLILGLALLSFYVISLPLRRQERDRFLLDVIESALAQGEQVERYIISLAQTRDRSPGIQFHLLAAHLETGCSFVDALEKTPRLFPPQLLAMLKVGESIGDLRKVLPACRKLLRDGISQSRAAINYQVVFAFVLNPMVLLAVPFLAVKIMPVFGEIFSGFGMKFSSLATTAIKLSPYIFAGQMLIVLALSLFSRPLLVPAADKFVTIHSSRVMSQSMPWMAQEAGLFKKYNIDHELVFIASSGIVTAALLGLSWETGTETRTQPLGCVATTLLGDLKTPMRAKPPSETTSERRSNRWGQNWGQSLRDLRRLT